MPLFAVRGKFANGHTFSVNPVDGADAREALGAVAGAQEVREFGSPVVMVTVKALTGAKKRIRISDAPAAERKDKKKDDKAAQAPAQPTKRR